jgi:transcriptional regulator with XRE-family HTH domain
MPSQQTPTVQRRRLGVQLRRRREAATLTIDDVAKSLDISVSKISRIETAHVTATWRDVRDMLDLYGVRGAKREELIDLAREARGEGWWHQDYSDLPVTFAGFEAAATSIQMYTPQVIPGLLQTKEYTQEVIEAIRADLTPNEVQHRVTFRIDRQKILLRDRPPLLCAVIDQSALLQPVGGPEVMREQLEYLMDAAAKPNIVLQVLPLRTGAHAGMDGGFTIFHFDEPEYEEVVFIDHMLMDKHLEDPDTVRRYKGSFDRLQSQAAPQEKTTEFITEAMEDLRQ